jgi:energy-coupling factor transporter transmembrane protein EcfT
MKDIRLFEYVFHRSLLHRLNPGIKIAGLIILCIGSGTLPFSLIILPTAFIAPLLFISGPAIRRQFAGMWKLFIFFAITGIIKALTTGLISEGISLSLRMSLMMTAGLLFYSSTRISALRKPLSSCLSRLPLINGARAAELTIMTLAFLPLVFQTMDELQQNRYSRCLKPGKNIFRTIKITSIPLMINMFIKTDEMADTWYSRCYGGKNN